MCPTPAGMSFTFHQSLSVVDQRKEPPRSVRSPTHSRRLPYAVFRLFIVSHLQTSQSDIKSEERTRNLSYLSVRKHFLYPQILIRWCIINNIYSAHRCGEILLDTTEQSQAFVLLFGPYRVDGKERTSIVTDPVIFRNDT